MEDLYPIAIRYTNDKSSIPIFLEIPRYFRDKTQNVLELIKRFNLKLDGCVGYEEADLFSPAKPYLYFVRCDLKGEENPSTDYKKRLKSLEKEMNLFLKKEYPILKIEIFSKVFCLGDNARVKLNSTLRSNLLELF